VPPVYWPDRSSADDPRTTWVIEHDRPRDFYDRGPYGTPGWRPDPRTGRHRRGERPDPIPAPATKEDYEARLREIAFERFIRKSAGLAAAHVSHRKRRTNLKTAARAVQLLRTFLGRLLPEFS
jgi:hypothetical protein